MTAAVKGWMHQVNEVLVEVCRHCLHSSTSQPIEHHVDDVVMTSVNQYIHARSQRAYNE